MFPCQRILYLRLRSMAPLKHVFKYLSDGDMILRAAVSMLTCYGWSLFAEMRAIDAATLFDSAFHQKGFRCSLASGMEVGEQVATRGRLVSRGALLSRRFAVIAPVWDQQADNGLQTRQNMTSYPWLGAVVAHSQLNGKRQ
jgi:hypothetical protein